MPRRTKLRDLLWLTLLGATFINLSAQACSVPVFRYALEHWAADAYQAVIFHRGPLSDAQSALVRDLSADGLAGRMRANLSTKTVDLAANVTPELLELARASGTNTLPWVVVRTPRTTRAATTVWSGALNEKNVTQLLDSPARKEIVDRLAQGQSAVWLFLESGDRAQDDNAARLLETRLAYLATTLALPKLDPQDIVNGLISVAQEDLRLDFSILRLARDAAAEQPFIHLLLGTEADLKTAGGPIAIPVFGRGRALYALVGAGIKRETIDQAATFLIGKCSCQVKEQNPGTDLLLAADWDKLVKAHSAAAPDLPSFSQLAQSAPMTVTISGNTDSATSTTDGSASPTNSTNERQPLSVRFYWFTGIAVAAFIIAGIRIRGRR